MHWLTLRHVVDHPAFLQTPENQQIPMVPEMTRSLQPLERAYQGMQGPMQTILEGVPWVPSRPLGMIDMPMALIPDQTSEAGAGGDAARP